MRKVGLVISILIGVFQLNADVTISIIANAGSGPILMPDTSPLADGSILSYGTFDAAGFATLDPGNINYDSLSNLFTAYGSYTFSGGEVVQINKPLSGGSTGQKLSIFVYTTDLLNVGIFSSTSPLWNYPADPGAATLSSAGINVSFPGAGEILSGTPNSFLLTAVPEPTTYALVFGIFGLGMVLWRRRK